MSYGNDFVLMQPRLLQLSVLVLCISEVKFAADVIQQPIDVVRASTVGNDSFECLETQYDMPLLFWQQAFLESKLVLIQSLNEQDVSIKHGTLI